MSTQFKPIEIPPGVVAKATKKMNSSNWSEVNCCRWVEGQLAPVGGQARYTKIVGGVEKYVFASRCKRIHGWYGLDQIYRIAYLCESNLYVDVGGTLIDISPGVAGTAVAYSAGNYSAGDYSGDAILGITPPVVGAGGYSDGLYGDSTYGTARAKSESILLDKVPDVYSLANFGAILLAMTSADGRLLHWDPASAPGTLATVVTPKTGSTVPHGRCFIVTSERFVQIFGSTQDGTTDGGSFRRIAWCNQEDYTDWSYSDLTTQAGFIDIEPSNPIITAVATRTGTLFWTSKKAYLSRYLGIPYIYNYSELADNCTPWSPQSMVTTSSMVLWFSQQGPYSYDGTSILPIQCMVRAWIDDDIDLLNAREEACAVHVANFNEFWWFFPQGRQSNPGGHNSRAIVYNYKEGWWSQAQMSRSAGVTASYASHTIMADGLVAYEHEAGLGYGAADLPWAETFDLNINSGSTLTTVKQMMPDVEGAISSVLYSLFYRNSRTLGIAEQQTARKPVRGNGFVDFRTTGRDIRLRIDFAPEGQVYPVTVGQHLIDAVPRGDR